MIAKHLTLNWHLKERDCKRESVRLIVANRNERKKGFSAPHVSPVIRDPSTDDVQLIAASTSTSNSLHETSKSSRSDLCDSYINSPI